MGAQWAQRPWNKKNKNGRFKKKKTMGSAHFLEVQFFRAHDPTIPNLELIFIVICRKIELDRLRYIGIVLKNKIGNGLNY